MKVAVLIPDRGDRPKFLENCLRMMSAQTLQPDIIELVNDAPLSEACDITWRYRIGYDRLRNRGIDVIALIENDDWYHPGYLEAMCHNWKMAFRPDILGLNQTMYYHLKMKSYFPMYHDTRSSAMNTLVKPDLNFPWCDDSDPYTDIHLWSVLKGRVIEVVDTTCIGIKHGVGLCGGDMHTSRLHRYQSGVAKMDIDFDYLKSVMDEASFNFYTNYFK